MLFCIRVLFSVKGSNVRCREIKDLIILSSCTLILALVSNYFWLLLLLVPVRLLWLLWGSVLRPWLSQERASEETEVDEKKQRKLERKMRRMR